MRFVTLTDTHFVPPGEMLYGLDPAARLAPALDLIATQHRDADFLLITGDLAHRGEPAAYLALAEALAGLPIPVHLMLGNHDARSAFRAAFPMTADIPGGFVQHRHDLGAASLLCLDTLIDIPGRHEGALCQTRLSWLADQLSALPADAPWVLAMHHPPSALGLPNMDAIALDPSHAEALAAVIAARPPVLMLCGHVHRPVMGVWRGVPFRIQRATAHQVAYRPARSERLMFSHEGPEFGVVTLERDGAVVVHTRSYLDEAVAFAKPAD
ncbi:MAG: metallophosphoesterase [Pikeienuella sp.]